MFLRRIPLPAACLCNIRTFRKKNSIFFQHFRALVGTGKCSMAFQQKSLPFYSPDLRKYKVLTGMLLGEGYDEETCAQYPELAPSLKNELEFFRNQYSDKYNSNDQCRIHFKSLVPEVRAFSCRYYYYTIV